MLSTKLINNAISAVLWNSLIMIFQRGSGHQYAQQVQIHYRAELQGFGYGSAHGANRQT